MLYPINYCLKGYTPLQAITVFMPPIQTLISRTPPRFVTPCLVWESLFAPWIIFLSVFGAFAVIPLSSGTFLQGSQTEMGLMLLMGIVSLDSLGILLAGWTSNNKYSLLGAIRAASQNISYELAMGLSIIAILMMTGSLSTKAIVEAQQNGHWNILYQPMGFIIFLICAFAECNRTPFDLPECETELIGGYHTEYSSMKLGFYLFAEYINMFISGAVMATLYFGGYDYPGIGFVTEQLGETAATLIGAGALIGKALAFVFIFMWVRWTLPRFRYDQLMGLGWSGLIPLAMFNVVVTGLGVLLDQQILVGIGGVVVFIAGIVVYDQLFVKKKLA